MKKTRLSPMKYDLVSRPYLANWEKMILQDVQHVNTVLLVQNVRLFIFLLTYIFRNILLGYFFP